MAAIGKRVIINFTSFGIISYNQSHAGNAVVCIAGCQVRCSATGIMTSCTTLVSKNWFNLLAEIQASVTVAAGTVCGMPAPKADSLATLLVAMFEITVPMMT